MGKRSNLKRRKNDAYMTFDKRATPPLIPFVKGQYYYEPCAGDGSLIKHLSEHGIRCAGYSDIADKHSIDVLSDEFDSIMAAMHSQFDIFITNPPWTRKILHPIIEKLRHIKPTWLLFDSDWAFTKQAAPYLRHCKRIVSVGRLRWVAGTNNDSKDNCAWYEFGAGEYDTIFHGRRQQ